MPPSSKRAEPMLPQFALLFFFASLPPPEKKEQGRQLGSHCARPTRAF